jgi:hypothetical protein
MISVIASIPLSPNIKNENENESIIIVLSFDVFTAVTMKIAVFWDMMPCGSCENRRFGGTYRLHHQCELVRARNNVSNNLQVPPKRRFLQKPHDITS